MHHHRIRPSGDSKEGYNDTKLCKQDRGHSEDLLLWKELVALEVSNKAVPHRPVARLPGWDCAVAVISP